MALDLQGNIVSAIQIITLILLVIGIYPYKIRTNNRNLIMHGFLSILTIGLNLTTVLTIMVPELSNHFALASSFSIVKSTIVWLHVIFGIVSLTLGFVIIISWVTHPLGELGCSKTWRLMIPTFLIWFTTLVLGLVIQIFNII